MASSQAAPNTIGVWNDRFPAASLSDIGQAGDVGSFLRVATLLGALERGFDFLAVLTAVYSAYGLYIWLGLGKQVHYPARDVLVCSAGFALLFMVLLERHGAYRPYGSLLAVRETERVLRVTAEGFLLALLVAYFTVTPISRLVITFAVILVPIFITLEEWEIYRLIRKLRNHGFGTRRAVILGAGTLGRRTYSGLARSPKLGLNAVAFVDDDPQKQGRSIYESSYHRKQAVPVLPGPVCPELLRQLRASVLVIAASSMSRDAMLKLATEAAAAGTDTYFVPGDFREPDYWIDYDELDGMTLAHFHQASRSPVNEFSKRLLDACLSTVLLVALSPVFTLIALAVKLTSRGRVLFRQRRVGKNGRRFEMYKFRTMFVDAPCYARSPEVEDDPRITPLGRWLRRTSVDELPQILNVLRGEMSLVGPRPEMPFIVEQYTPLQRQRLLVKPGMTGLWQLSDDRARPIHENMEYDLYYLQNNPWFLWEIGLQLAHLRKFEIDTS